jgi:hypothetical protein
MAGRPRNKNDLARVVRQRVDELVRTGLRQWQIAARCQPPLAPYDLSRIANGTTHDPGRESLAALAIGLEMPLEELQAAVLRAPAGEGAAPAAPQPLPCASAIALQTAAVLGPEQIRTLDVEFARVLREAANSTTDRRR